jgi:hypothetical protein
MLVIPYTTASHYMYTTVGAARYLMTRFCSRPWEVYSVGPDGAETFVGYERQLIKSAGNRWPRWTSAEPLPELRA